MTSMSQCKVVLTGSAVTGGGVSVFYTIGTGSALANALHAMYNVLKGYMPTGANILVSAEGVILDSNTGELEGAWSGGTTSPLSGGDTGQYAKGAGVRLVWPTDGFTGGRKVVGATYLVPLAGSAYDNAGTISDTNRLSILGAVNTFRTTMGSDQVIWTRPRASTSGVEHSVVNGLVPDKVAWLSSRRD